MTDTMREKFCRHLNIIHTPGFRSLERYLRLQTALDGISTTNALHHYGWLKKALEADLAREEAFIARNKVVYINAILWSES